jgi:hypothetical protein
MSIHFLISCLLSTDEVAPSGLSAGDMEFERNRVSISSRLGWFPMGSGWDGDGHQTFRGRKIECFTNDEPPDAKNSIQSEGMPFLTQFRSGEWSQQCGQGQERAKCGDRHPI